MSADTPLICPRCELPLEEVRTSGGIFWGCNVCGGRSVTIDLLRKRFTPESINPLWLHAMRSEGQGSCACPLCRRAMLEVALSERATVDVDVCRHCQLIWFDAREVEHLAPRAPPPAAPAIPQKAREILALARVEQLAKEAEGSDFDSAAPDESWKQIAALLGMPVEFDAAPQLQHPWTTWLLVAAITAISAFAFTRLHEIVAQFGLIPAHAMRLHGLTFATSFFLHAGIIHLVGNMYFLLVFGDNAEDFLGPLRYLALIALSAFIGDLAHIALDPRSQIPCIGASGGIAGVITFYALNFPRIRLAFLMRWGFMWFRWIRLPAWSVFILWIFFQLIGLWEQKAGMNSVSSSAHLGGAAVGFVEWLLWRQKSRPAEVSRL
jgi:membrane associated rhomboid family serine protease/Zn-finger nucleic acid-binding protein